MVVYLSIAVPEIEGFPTVLTSFAAAVLPSSEEISGIIWRLFGVAEAWDPQNKKLNITTERTGIIILIFMFLF